MEHMRTEKVLASAPQLPWISRRVFQTAEMLSERCCLYVCIQYVCVCIVSRLQTDGFHLFMQCFFSVMSDWTAHDISLGDLTVCCSFEGWLCDRIYAFIGWPHKHCTHVAHTYTGRAQALCMLGVFLSFLLINLLQRQKCKCDLEH